MYTLHKDGLIVMAAVYFFATAPKPLMLTCSALRLGLLFVCAFDEYSRTTQAVQNLRRLDCLVAEPGNVD